MTEQTVAVAVPVPIHQVFSYLPPEGHAPVPLGCRVVVPFGRRTLTGCVVGPGEPIADSTVTLKRIQRVLDQEPLFDQSWLEMARWVSSMYLATLGETLSAMLPGAKEARELPPQDGAEPADAPEGLVLSEEQHAAVQALITPVSPGTRSWHYLYGITGSGKTEVFLQAATVVLHRGGSVLYLVPEIALTHQLFEHISRRFGSLAAMLHSGLTPAQRLGEWQRIRRGEARLVIGARSAVFAPVLDLQLVVIDEEHEGSYKSGNTPRYHARQVALHRSVTAGATCVMGSAPPSVEAWHLMEEGTLNRLNLTRRLSGGALPEIRVLDVRGSNRLISRQLEDLLRETHRLGAQSILFLNRRGFAGAFSCNSCGYHFDCPQCSVPMTWHRGEHRMVCHYCGHIEPPVSLCPQCGSLDVGYRNFGTERVEEEVAQLLPELRIARLDTDSTRRKGVLAKTLKEFASGSIDLLLGTQMVAKGLNFPGVRTVGIVMADTGLSLPDFRAAERTFGLIVQVAGRAGRFRKDGLVVIQTVRQEHSAIQRAAEMDIPRFYQEELYVRQQLQFPPFTRILRLLVRGRRREDAERTAAHLAGFARELVRDGDVTVLGPAPAALEKIQRNWRFQVLLRGSTAGAVVGTARRVVQSVTLPRGVYVEVDVDPVNLL